MDAADHRGDRIGHRPVLLAEVLELLAPRAGETALDCTAGRGGHAEALARAVGPSGTVILNDLDPSNVAFARERVEALEAPPRVVALEGNFAEAPRRLRELGERADVVLADLGFASVHVDDAARGFSFNKPGPLDMRYDPGARWSAADLVNTLPEQELAEILRDFGEEPRWRAVARKLVAERAREPIRTTERLASIVRGVAGPRSARGGSIDPATKVFQGLRIAVNDEIGSLGSFLEAVRRDAEARGPDRFLAADARVGVIAFHSLEDRVVKQRFRDLADRGVGETLTRRPVKPSEEETRSNPRARSARLRGVRLVPPSPG